MDDSDKKSFATMFYAMGEYYDKKVSTDLLKMYFSDLSDFSISDIEAGAKAHRLDSKYGTFFPKPADIVRHLQTSALSVESKAELAWAQIQQCLRVNGSYGGLKIDDRQGIAALKSFTTWKDFCAMDVNRQTWAKKEFISMYSTYENAPIELLPSSLPGLVGLHNHKEKQSKSATKSVVDILSKLNNLKHS